jgi:hypothetical protein
MRVRVKAWIEGRERNEVHVTSQCILLFRGSTRKLSLAIGVFMGWEQVDLVVPPRILAFVVHRWKAEYVCIYISQASEDVWGTCKIR